MKQINQQADLYMDLDSNAISLARLDDEERRLVARLRRRARTHPDWCAFGNYWTRAVLGFYDARGLTRRQTLQTAAYQIAQDLSSRLGLAQGLIRPDDYLSDWEELVLNRFGSRQAFCQATGIAEQVLDRVLAGRQELSLEALTQALERIGYQLRIVPGLERKSAARKQTG